MAQADDPEVPGHEPRPEAPSSRFWQRYSGRPGEPTGDEDLGEDPLDDVDDAAAGGDDHCHGHAEDDRHSHAGGHRHSHSHPDGHQCLDWCPICRGAELLRAAVPPELQEQFQAVQRDALLLAQSMIEAHLERLKRDPADAGQDDPDISSIPID